MKKYDKFDSLLIRIKSLRPFDENTQSLINDRLLLEWTYNSNAIEGNTLTYKETSFYLLRGLTSQGKPLQDHIEASNHKDAILYLESIIQEKDFYLSEKIVKEIHKILFNQITKVRSGALQSGWITITGGSYKKQNNHVMKSDGTVHYYVDALSVSHEMKKLLDWYNKNKNLHPLPLAAMFHYKFVEIHPFTDGNGRLARLLMNLILMKNHVPPAIVKFDEREKYYQALEEADSGDMKPFISFIKDQAVKTMGLILSVASGNEQKRSQKKHKIYKLRIEKNITQIELARLTQIGQAMISRIENMKESPTQATLAKFAKVLKVKIEDL